MKLFGFDTDESVKQLFQNFEELKKDLTWKPLPSGPEVWEQGKKNGEKMKEEILKKKGAEMATDVLQTISPVGLVAGLIKGQKVFRGALKDKDTFGKISRRFEQPGHEFGTHVSIDPATAEEFSDKFLAKAANKQAVVYELESKVDKPLKLRDTGGSWSPDTVIDAIEDAVATTTKRETKYGDYVEFKDLPKDKQDALIERGLDTPNLLYHPDKMYTTINNKDVEARFSDKALEKLKELRTDYRNQVEKYFTDPSIKKKHANLSMYVSDIDHKFAKDLQKVIKEEGYDHISYINTVEGVPSESAILFDEADVGLLNIK